MSGSISIRHTVESTPMRRGPPAFGRRTKGFGMLETMVALVIFTGAAMALYGLFNTDLIALARTQDVSRRVPAARHAIEYLSSINPRKESAGSFEHDGFDVVWTAKLLQPVRQSQTMTGAQGSFEIGLYEIEFAMSERGRPMGSWRLRLIGHEKVRESGY